MFPILLSAGALLEAQAGEPVEPVTVVEAEPVFSGSISGGYDSTYVFRGVDFGSDAIWTGIDMNLAMTESLNLNFGAWYINPTGGGADNDELDLYAFLTQSIGDFEIGLGFTEYLFPEAGGDVPEAALSLGYSLASVDLGFLYAYDFEADGSYLELNAGYSIELSDRISLDLGTGIGYGDQYYGVSGFNHVFVTASLPIAITETLT
ncbi:MAG: TorF family putative porin, partial [Verrucomicrobiales bacterium]